MKPAGKSIAILQSNYMPWKGYFDIIASVDEFLIFDDVQFTRRDWRNRNKIVLAGKVHWLTVPVRSKGSYNATIEAIEIADAAWAKKHWMTIRHAYEQGPSLPTMGRCSRALRKSGIDCPPHRGQRAVAARLADVLAFCRRASSEARIFRARAPPHRAPRRICLARAPPSTSPDRPQVYGGGSASKPEHHLALRQLPGVIPRMSRP